MSCPDCIQTTSNGHIKRPDDLKRCIAKAAQLVESGTLRYVGAGKFGEPFQILADGELWGDIVSNYFSCTKCGQLFHLHAETYHGSGGAFESIQQIDGNIQ